MNKHAEAFASADFKKDQNKARRRSYLDSDVPEGKNPIASGDRLRFFFCKSYNHLKPNRV